MSIILGLITQKNGIVISDGRMFGNARLENGKVIQAASIQSEQFDKTFSSKQRTFIGAFAGLMHFSGKDVSGHVTDLLHSLNDPKAEFGEIAKELCEGIKAKLTNITPNEVAFGFRKLDLLLIGHISATKRELVIGRSRFGPNGGQIVCSMDIYSANNLIKYCVFGDDKAQGAVQRAIKNNHAPNRDAGFLKKLAVRALEAGIKSSGLHPYGSEPACGGEMFLQVIHCK